eukprot:1160011-Pelagomonas_calceolata.AAC.8
MNVMPAARHKLDVMPAARHAQALASFITLTAANTEQLAAASKTRLPEGMQSHGNVSFSDATFWEKAASLMYSYTCKTVKSRRAMEKARPRKRCTYA